MGDLPEAAECRPCRRNPPPFSFVKTKENCRGRSKENRIYEQASRLSVNTGVVRTGLVGIDGPVGPALYPGSRNTLSPHRPCGGGAGVLVDLVCFSFRCRCLGAREKPRKRLQTRNCTAAGPVPVKSLSGRRVLHPPLRQNGTVGCAAPVSSGGTHAPPRRAAGLSSNAR